MNLNSQQVIKILESNGWVFIRQSGSHKIYKHPDSKLIISVPNHGKQIKKGTYSSILKNAGLKNFVK